MHGPERTLNDAGPKSSSGRSGRIRNDKRPSVRKTALFPSGRPLGISERREPGSEGGISIRLEQLLGSNPSSQTAIGGREPGLRLGGWFAQGLRQYSCFQRVRNDFVGPEPSTVVKFVTGNSSRINSVQQSRKCNLLNLREIKCIPKR